MAAWSPNRREVLLTVAAGLVVPRLAHAQESYAGQFIRAGKARRFLLGPDNPPTEVWQFKTSGNLPVLRARQGEEFRFRVFNTLETELWLHFFGVRGASDGMTVTVPAGPEASVDVVFTPPDAGTFWFGPLLDASRQRDMGLSGLLIVDEAQPISGLADVPLIIDDWMIDEQGRTDQGFGSLKAAIGAGRTGNWFTVNGAYKPRIDIDNAMTSRLRLLNACNARTLMLQFKNIDLIVIAEDGQPVVPRPVGLDPVRLIPGQRMDLLGVHAAEQAVVSLDLQEDVVELAFLVATGQPGAGVADNFVLPANPLPVADAAKARTVPLVLEGGARGGLQSARVGEVELPLRSLLEKGLAWAMNGIAGPGGPVLFEATKREMLVLAIDNKTSFAQPLHIHGHVWQLVEQDGKVVDDQPWRDTAEVGSLSTAKLLLVADNPGSWAIQSLIAERCDAGLIGGFRVV